MFENRFYRTVWEKVMAHTRKWRDLPLIPAPTGVECPPMDGDIAWLHHLADRIAEHAENGAEVEVPPPNSLYLATRRHTSIDPPVVTGFMDGLLDRMRLEGERIQRWRRDLHLQTQVLDLYIEALFDEKEEVA